MDIATSTPKTKSITLRVNAGAVIGFAAVAIPALLQLILDPTNQGVLSSILSPKALATLLSVAGTVLGVWNLWLRFKTSLPIAGTSAAALNEQVLSTALAMPPSSTVADLSKVVTAVNTDSIPLDIQVGEKGTLPGGVPTTPEVKAVLAATTEPRA